MEAVLEAPGAQEAVQCRPQPTAKDVSASCVDLTRAGSLESSQTFLNTSGTLTAHDTAPGCIERRSAVKNTVEPDDVYTERLTDDVVADTAPTECWLGNHSKEQPSTAALLACIEMIGHHKSLELKGSEHSMQGRDNLVADAGSRMIVVSWMVEVAEEFGLQQETLHSAIALLDRFLRLSNDVPPCALQLVAVGCLFLAAKQLEVHQPSVAQLVAVAAHSFSAHDLLRVERVLLDALEFSIISPTPYNFLHLLTQGTFAATSCTSSCLETIMAYSPDPTTAAAANAILSAAAYSSSSNNCPPMERVVSLAMYLIEIAVLDMASIALPCSKIATAAFMLAFTTLSGVCDAWSTILAVADTARASCHLWLLLWPACTLQQEPHKLRS